MIAMLAVSGAAGRIAAEPAFECRRLDLLVQLEAWIERLLAGAILDQLDRLEQAAASDIADMAVIAEAFGQPLLEMLTQLLDVVEHLLLSDHPLHFECRCAGHRVRQVSMAVLECAGAPPDRIDDATRRQHRAD